MLSCFKDQLSSPSLAGLEMQLQPSGGTAEGPGESYTVVERAFHGAVSRLKPTSPAHGRASVFTGDRHHFLYLLFLACCCNIGLV